MQVATGVALTLQRLHGAQVAAQVVGVERLLLLGDPVLGLVHVAVEALHLVRRAQLRRALRRQLLQRRPLRVQLLGEGRGLITNLLQRARLN